MLDDTDGKTTLWWRLWLIGSLATPLIGWLAARLLAGPWIPADNIDHTDQYIVSGAFSAAGAVMMTIASFKLSFRRTDKDSKRPSSVSTLGFIFLAIGGVCVIGAFYFIGCLGSIFSA